MALLVWLPLDNFINNQGLLGNIQNFSLNGLTQNNSGKIGKCYSGYAIYHLSEEFLSNEWSLALWVKATAWGVNNDILLCKNSTASTACQFYFSVINGKTFNLGINGGSSTTSYSYTFAVNTWYHLAATYDGSNYALYINGNLVKVGTHTSAQLTGHLNLGIGCRSTNAGGTSLTGYSATKYYNDIRIYDHALSYKEVKELSKGLILHYRLSKPMPNLLKNGAFTSLTTGTTGLGTGIYANYWGGYNGGISNPTTNYHACIDLNTFGYPVYIYNETNGSRNWKGISLSISKNLIEGSTDYIFSCDVYLTLSGGKIFGGFHYKKTGATSASFASGQYTISASMIPKGNWTKISIKVPFNDNIDSSVSSVTFYIYGYGFSDNGIVYIKNVKLEKGIGATTFIPNESDTLYSALGYDSDIELDCAPAGNQNDGTIVGTITAAADSPRYETSYHFPSGANYINAGRGAMVTDAITVNMWIKYTNWGNPISCTEGGGWNFEEGGGGIRFPIYTADNTYRIAQSTITSASLKDNNWHMLTGTYDGENVKIYIDGKEEGTLVASTSHKNIKYNPNNVIFIGAEAGGNATTPASTSFIGNISDFRVYCTALSAEDIAELYHTAAQIDKDGNVYAYEFKEA